MNIVCCTGGLAACPIPTCAVRRLNEIVPPDGQKSISIRNNALENTAVSVEHLCLDWAVCCCRIKPEGVGGGGQHNVSTPPPLDGAHSHVHPLARAFGTTVVRAGLCAVNPPPAPPCVLRPEAPGHDTQAQEGTQQHSAQPPPPPPLRAIEGDGGRHLPPGGRPTTTFGRGGVSGRIWPHWGRVQGSGLL